jgi:hypothetical protein
MPGINRLNWSIKYDSSRELREAGITCVFISHQKRDQDAAKKIADYLLSCDINVYFDEYDEKLKFHHQTSNPKEVTSAICTGINNSSHMLVLVSPSTLHSTWVPFEIGYGYDDTELAVLCLRGISKGSLPEYVRTTRIIRDIYDLNPFISQLTGKSEQMLSEARMIGSYSNANHPLASVMDGVISDQY